ncbi:acetyltransferase [Pseudomonas matsuisoli]|uniref:Acetyltransferase n=1 Tax=Pseudomonas matsuisoli TaxID=1515666 RepID=A0A917Q598_9PSED|nr:acetyltransferase [Pseudomonas matsuisoli]GGK10622.1 acetyltransferase [Pseudomonas matsuisoli]
MKTLLILGAGGHGKSVAEAALLGGLWQRVVFADDRWPKLEHCFGCDVVSDIAGLARLSGKVQGAIAAVGNNERRESWCRSIEDTNIPLVTVIHPRAFVSGSATIGLGCAIMAGTIVGTDAVLGRAAILNAGAIVDHDAVLDDLAHIGVGVSLAGGVRVGRRAWLQAGVSAGYGVAVGDGAVVTPGMVLSAH